MTHALRSSFASAAVGCLVALLLCVGCDKKDDGAATGPKPPGAELSTVAGTSIKQVAADAPATPAQDWWTFNGLNAKGATLDELVLQTLPPDGWMGNAQLPEGRYDIRIDLSGKTPEEMRPTLFKAIESAFGLKLSLARQDMDGLVIRVPEGSQPSQSLAKAAPDATLALTQPGGKLRFTAVSMDTFADWASRELEMPVVNATELTGKFTFELPAAGKLDAAALTAAGKELGLEITGQRLEQQVLTAEKAEAAN